jgi:hypothetical protein
MALTLMSRPLASLMKAKLQGGSVSLHSALGQGSIFTVWLLCNAMQTLLPPASGKVPTVCDGELKSAAIGISLAAIDHEMENAR